MKELIAAEPNTPSTAHDDQASAQVAPVQAAKVKLGDSMSPWNKAPKVKLGDSMLPW